MSVEVYAPGGKVLIGHLAGPEPRDLRVRRSYEIALDLVEDDLGSLMNPHATMAPLRARRFVALGVEARKVRVSNYEIATGSFSGRPSDDVPDYAEELRDPMQDGWVFVWPALVAPNAEVAELVFDLAAFEPVGKPCCASMGEAHWWHMHEGGAKFHAGGLVTGTINAGAITAVPTSAINASMIQGNKLLTPSTTVNVVANSTSDLSKVAKSVEEALRQAGRSMQKAFDQNFMRTLAGRA